MSIRNMQVKTHKSINKIEKIVNMLRVLYGVDYTGIIVYDMLMILTNKKKKHCVYFFETCNSEEIEFYDLTEGNTGTIITLSTGSRVKILNPVTNYEFFNYEAESVCYSGNTWAYENKKVSTYVRFRANTVIKSVINNVEKEIHLHRFSGVEVKSDETINNLTCAWLDIPYLVLQSKETGKIALFDADKCEFIFGYEYNDTLKNRSMFDSVAKKHESK